MPLYTQAVTSKTDVAGGSDNSGPVMPQSVFKIFRSTHTLNVSTALHNANEAIAKASKFISVRKNISFCKHVWGRGEVYTGFWCVT